MTFVSIFILYLSDCVPYSGSACRKAATKLGKAFVSGYYGTKGCYHYPNGEYPNVYYGKGGSEDENKGPTGSTSKVRPQGYDCKFGNSE